VELATAVVSIVTPDAPTTVRASFCNQCRHLCCDGGRLVRGQGAAHPPLLGQAPAVDELHDQVEPAVEGAEVVHAHDVRMVETGRGLCLQPEPLDVRRLVRSQELDRDGAPENLVSRSPHLAHRAASHHVEQLRGMTFHEPGQTSVHFPDLRGELADPVSQQTQRDPSGLQHRLLADRFMFPSTQYTHAQPAGW
jgi:hypothetical protein